MLTTRYAAFFYISYSLYIDMFVGPGKLFIDTLAGTAKIPGDGTAKTTFTYTPDIGQFVAASLDLERWDEVSGIVGETKTWDEAVDVAEVVTGKKFQRTYMKEGGGEAAKQLLERKFLAGVRSFPRISLAFVMPSLFLFC